MQTISERMFKVINAINVDGLDNSEWGICRNCEGIPLRDYFGADTTDVILSDCIYVGLPTEDVDSWLSLSPDGVYTVEDGRFTCLIWYVNVVK